MQKCLEAKFRKTCRFGCVRKNNQKNLNYNIYLTQICRSITFECFYRKNKVTKTLVQFWKINGDNTKKNLGSF